MDSVSKGQAWVENLRHRFSTFCSEADEIICQDSVKYVRTQLITAGENFMHLCSEIVEDVLHDFSVDSAGKNGLASPTQEQDVNFPAQKMLSIRIDTDKDGKSCSVNSTSTLLSIEPVGERCADIQSDGKDEASNRFGKHTLDGDECIVHAYFSTSVQPPAANSFEKMEAAALAMDESILDADQVENLIKFCPTTEEMELLKGYTGDMENLGKCEQLKAVASVTLLIKNFLIQDLL